MVALLMMAKLTACLALGPLLVAATPEVDYPLNVQLPPIARVGIYFSFQFAPTTFSSGSESLHYSLIGNPSWLSLDENSRMLSGIPQSGDVGMVNFTISAAGQGGAVANMNSQLLVSTEDGPATNNNISVALAAAGQISGPNTVSLKASNSFDISIPREIFDQAKAVLSYSALLIDRTPLPAWISFDASAIRFTGTAPPTASPQSFQVLLIASDTPGFADSSVAFTMVITNHAFGFNPFSQTISVAKGDNVHITDLKAKLSLDSEPVDSNEIQSVTADIPSWLSFDNTTLELSGNAPTDLKSQNLTITAMDRFGDIALYTINLVLQSELFANEIGRLDLTPGTPFKYEIPRTVLADDDASVSLDFAALAKYLSFDSSTFIISGMVPDDFPAQDVQCSLVATSDDGATKGTQVFSMVVSEVANSPSGQPSGNLGSHEQTSGDKREAVIVGAVVGAVCGALLLVGCVVCLCRRKKTVKSSASPELQRSPRKFDISRPTLIPYEWPEVNEHVEHDLEKGNATYDHCEQYAPEHPPKLDLDLSSDRRDSHSLADTIGDADTRILDTFEESSFGIYNDIAPSQHPHDSMKIPTELAKRASQKSASFRKHKRQSTTVYHEQIHRSNGLPVNRRITGMGHGRHTYSPSQSNTNFSSFRRPVSTGSNATTRCTSTFSTTPSAFMQSPTARKHTTIITPTVERRSIRIQPGSKRSSGVDWRTIDEKRKSYIRKRASTQSPFFSAGARTSSSSYKSPPAFIAEPESSPRGALSPTTRNTVVRPDDDVVQGREKEIPATVRLIRPSGSLKTAPRHEFPGSLRQNRINRPYTAITPSRNRVEKNYDRPGTAMSSDWSSCGRRASTRNSFRAHNLKASLNDLTGSKVFEDAELSDSVYSDEEKVIEEAEKRTTVKPGQYMLPPLNLDRVDTTRNKKRESTNTKRESNRDSKRGLKRTSERDPTPYFLGSEHEHGGKENASSTYTLGQRSSPVRLDTKGKARALSSPERPKPLAARHSRTAPDTRNPKRASAKRTSKAPSLQDTTQERHSRKSIHSRTQSRLSGPLPSKKARERSRTQSSAYPYFDATIFESTDNNNTSRRGSVANTLTTATPADKTKASFVARDLSGNLTFYGSEGDEPTIEELGSSSIGFRTSMGRVNSTARRQSRLASLHLASSPPPPLQPKSPKRKTVAAIPSSSMPPPAAAGLGLFPRESVGDEKRERAPLGTLQMGNRVTVKSEEQGRRTWGNLSLKGIVGRGSRWVSGGHRDWQVKEDTSFI